MCVLDQLENGLFFSISSQIRKISVPKPKALDLYLSLDHKEPTESVTKLGMLRPGYATEVKSRSKFHVKLIKLTRSNFKSTHDMTLKYFFLLVYSPTLNLAEK